VLESCQERVAVIVVGDDEHLDQDLSCFPREEGLDPADVAQSTVQSTERSVDFTVYCTVDCAVTC